MTTSETGYFPSYGAALRYSAQHTPGPWIIGGDTKRGSEHFGQSVREIWGGKGNETAVALVLYGADKLPHAASGDAQGDADARLIAAAPDLLAALESAVIRLEHLGSEETGRCAATENARAAIARAKGVTP